MLEDGEAVAGVFSGKRLIAAVESFCKVNPSVRVKDSVVVELVLELTIASPKIILGRLPGGNIAQADDLRSFGTDFRNPREPGGLRYQVIHCALEESGVDIREMIDIDLKVGAG